MEGLKEKISEITEKKIDEIFSEAQDLLIKEGKEVTGDIEPLESFRLSELVEEIKEIVFRQINQ
jgi:restriction endonuclease S subunit